MQPYQSTLRKSMENDIFKGEGIVRESIEIIVSEFTMLNDEEKNLLLTWLTKHYGKHIEISSTGLSLCNQDDVETIRNTLSGLILTKKYVPDMLGSREWLKGENLPQKI
ncbi:hypothetical protein [Brevibacillus sp. NRS-1366]|uniref:hypothetical protein n=1 Tax=Brevibacillus sp. NRS-1366 TaxID=3233899 RepID=UPI003D1F8B6F